MKKLLTNLGLLFASVILVLIIAEIFLRIFYPQNLNMTTLDEKRMYKLKPNLETSLNREDFQTHVSINSDGYRDYEHGVWDGRKKIAVVGDSFTFGFGVEQNESFPSLLEKKTGFEVFNFGISAYGTEQELLLIKDNIVYYNPDEIILAFYMNDLRENVKFGLFNVTDGKLKYNNKKFKSSVALVMREFMSHHSHLYSLVYSALIDKSILTRIGLINAQPEDPNMDYDTLNYFNVDNDGYNFAMNKALLLINETRNLAVENGIKFVLFAIPSKEQVDDERMKKYLYDKGAGHFGFNSTKVQQILEDFAFKNNITIINPLPTFRGMDINNTFYFNVDGHWNREGHKLASEALNQHLI